MGRRFHYCCLPVAVVACFYCPFITSSRLSVCLVFPERGAWWLSLNVKMNTAVDCVNRKVCSDKTNHKFPIFNKNYEKHKVLFLTNNKQEELMQQLSFPLVTGAGDPTYIPCDFYLTAFKPCSRMQRVGKPHIITTWGACHNGLLTIIIGSLKSEIR